MPCNNILTVPLKPVFGLENIFIMMDKDLWRRFCRWKLIVEPCWILNRSLDVPGYWITRERAKKGSIPCSGKKIIATASVLTWVILPVKTSFLHFLIFFWRRNLSKKLSYYCPFPTVLFGSCNDGFGMIFLDIYSFSCSYVRVIVLFLLCLYFDVGLQWRKSSLSHVYLMICCTRAYQAMVIFVSSQNSFGILNFIILSCWGLHVKCFFKVSLLDWLENFT